MKKGEKWRRLTNIVRERQSLLEMKNKKIEKTLIHGAKYFTQKHVTKNYGPKLERKKKNAVK